MRLKVRNKFNFGRFNNKARILFQTTYSNIFLSLLDLNNNLVCFVSGGHIPGSFNKKKKTPLYNIAILMEYLSKYLKLYKITNIIFDFRAKRFFFYGFYFLDQFKLYGLHVDTFKHYVPVAHNGVKGRHIRYKKTHKRRRRAKRRR